MLTNYLVVLLFKTHYVNFILNNGVSAVLHKTIFNIITIIIIKPSKIVKKKTEVKPSAHLKL